MEFAEQYAIPIEGQLGPSFPRQNDFKETFSLRWGQIRFRVHWGVELNLKVILKVYREDGICERFVVDTDPLQGDWNSHERLTRDFYVCPFPKLYGRVVCVKFSFIVHRAERSIPSEYDYIFMDGWRFNNDRRRETPITNEGKTLNTYRTYEVDAELLQRDAQWFNRFPEDTRLIPKFTKGLPYHPYHPKRFIHDRIDELVQDKATFPRRHLTIKVCVDCIDDADFAKHLIHASKHGIDVQCQVDWRKMTLTNSENYLRLKRSGVELLGVFCTPKDPRIEVAPDMHNKFLIFGDDHCILGSFNITFDRWGANWESGMTFHSQGVCRMLDNIFQSVRGGVIQKYEVDPFGPFNLLYTFGRQALEHGKYYRPHHAILSEIHRARRSIKICLFLIGEMLGEYNDSVIDALIAAQQRDVEVQLILNGHLAREGDPSKERALADELRRPLLPAIARLRDAGIPVALVYGQHDLPIPYSPLHSKSCVIDERVVIDGSFNWYNTSIFSHDLMVVTKNPEAAQLYLKEFDEILEKFRVY